MEVAVYNSFAELSIGRESKKQECSSLSKANELAKRFSLLGNNSYVVVRGNTGDVITLFDGEKKSRLIGYSMGYILLEGVCTGDLKLTLYDSNQELLDSVVVGSESKANFYNVLKQLTYCILSPVRNIYFPSNAFKYQDNLVCYYSRLIQGDGTCSVVFVQDFNLPWMR